MAAFRTLALQGGGCLGKGQAVALSLLAERLGMPLWQHFQLIGGTSVGAIVGGLVAAGIEPAQINAFFDGSAPKIFHRSFWNLAVSRLWDSAKYDPAALETALRQLLDDRTLRDCETRFMATAVDMASGRNVYFQSYGVSSEAEDELIIAPDSGIELWQVLRASSAAQSYFPGLKWSLAAFHWNGLCFWDGGSTSFNAPDMLVYEEAKEVAAEADITMLSLGAGRQPWPYAGRDMSNPGVATVLGATLEIAYANAALAQVWLAKRQMGSRHQHLNPELGRPYAIDDASRGTLTAIGSAWTAAVNEFSLTV